MAAKRTPFSMPFPPVFPHSVSRCFRLLTMAAAVLSITLTARADILIDTISGGSNQGTWQAGYHAAGAEVPGWAAYSTTVACGFTLGAQSYSLDSVVLHLTAQDANATANVRVGIFSNNGGSPGTTQIGSYLLNPTLAVGIDSDYTFLASGITLAANTTYWLEITALEESAVLVRALQFDSPVAGLATPAGTRLLGNNPFSTGWSSASEPVAVVISATEADSVPEPSTWALMLAGLAGSVAILKRRSARA